MVSQVVVDDPQVNVSQELARHIRDLLVLRVELYGFLVAVGVALPQLHVVHPDAIVGEGLPMDVPDGLADLEELLVLINSSLVLAQVVKEDARAVVSAALVSGLAGSLASEGQDVVVLETLLGSDPVVRVSVTHVQAGVVLQHLVCQFLSST